MSAPSCAGFAKLPSAAMSAPLSSCVVPAGPPSAPLRPAAAVRPLPEALVSSTAVADRRAAPGRFRRDDLEDFEAAEAAEAPSCSAVLGPSAGCDERR